MTELPELERRISAALKRIGDGLDRLPAAEPAAPADDAALRIAAQEIARLKAELAAAQAAAAIPAAAPDPEAAGLRARVEELTRQLDDQGLELSRMRQTTIQLRETLRAMREQQQGQVEAHLLNKAMLAELEALRAVRASEVIELEQLISELVPILEANPDQTPPIAEETTDA